MLNVITPNRAVIFAILAPIIYWVLAPFIPPSILRDVLNPIAFGVALMISLTWAWAMIHSVRRKTQGWQLILAVFIVWTVIWAQSTYRVVFNAYGRPDTWNDGVISGFWPYSYIAAGILFLASTDTATVGWEKSTLWIIGSAIAIGGFAAGILVALNIPAT